MIDKNKYYVFYDGDCGFCNFWVQWILENDKEDQYLFAALQSDFGQNFLKERSLKSDDFDTIYLWKPNAFYLTKLDAILKIANTIGGIYYFANISKIFPKFIRNLGYDLIAKNRKKLMEQTCIIPTPEQRKKFVE
ncbi:membrane protein [Cloacibacterium rupense]|uniref:Membrane protein n=1 Tax=Cloacibacterium rupense TaxID=517423 RepID=A0ABQ2NKS2_9FLAO|nr:DCC1-like thiol-disulfide oxidoreductase family protein [Cloacibacterium rupense]GGP04667.1 membrane protein [Cloacibacterium rupense]